MLAAYSSSLAGAIGLVRSNKLTQRVAAGYESAFRRSPSDEELATWSEVVPLALQAAEDLPPAAHVLIECPLPFNDQRIDLLFVGANSSGPSAAVLELKRWTLSQPSELANHVEVAGHPTVHPSYQALGYAAKLRHLHSFGSELSIEPAVLLINGKSANEHLFAARFRELLDRAPIFLRGEEGSLSRRLNGQITMPAAPESVSRLLQGEYTQSPHLLEMVSVHQRAILARAAHVLAGSGWGLTSGQLLAFDHMMRSIMSGERVVYAVAGSPGSGKSLLAMHLFLGAVGAGKQTILAVRNNRLNAALQHILDAEVLGARGMVKYFSTGRAGVEDDSDALADVLICDEAQRLAFRSANVLMRAPVVVLLFDENQILNEAERGTAANFTSLCQRIGAHLVRLELPTPLRCRGGAVYLRWVDRLLANPNSITEPLSALNGYEIAIADTPASLQQRLQKRGNYQRVGLLASFTRASGRSEPKSPQDLGVVRFPELQPPIRWLMEPKKQYVPFYVDGRSNDLTHCASIYGAQGFELDYAGLIWGTDLVIRNGRWVVGDPKDCYDAAPGAKRLSTVMREDPDTALRLLCNRYRILLTRGIFGTAIYFEDEDTRQYMLARANFVY